MGTTGLSNETLQELAALAPDGTCLFYAPNFTTGAVLMMEFAKAAAPYFPEAEVIEFHHCNKKDAPSGTAVRTAQIIAEARGGRASEAPGKETEIEGAEGARGALVDGVPVHSVRSMGYVASQDRSARRCPSAMTHGTVRRTCRACCWAFVAWARATGWL